EGGGARRGGAGRRIGADRACPSHGRGGGHHARRHRTRGRLRDFHPSAPRPIALADDEREEAIRWPRCSVVSGPGPARTETAIPCLRVGYEALERLVAARDCAGSRLGRRDRTWFDRCWGT